MKTNKGNKSLLLAVIIVIIVAFLLCSCGARKVNKSKTETKEVTTNEATLKDSSKTVTKVDTNIKIIDSSTSDEFTITPIDSSKEFSVNGIKYKGVVLRHKKVKNNISTTKTEKTSQIKQNDIKTANKSNKVKTKVVEVKKVDKKQYDWTKTIIIISVILGLACWLIYFFYFRKSKKVINEVV